MLDLSDLAVVDAALKRADLLTDDERVALERHSALMRSTLLGELKRAVLRDDRDVALALAREACRKLAHAKIRPHKDLLPREQ